MNIKHALEQVRLNLVKSDQGQVIEKDDFYSKLDLVYEEIEEDVDVKDFSFFSARLFDIYNVSPAIFIFYALEEKDVAPDRAELFKALRQPIVDVISEAFNSNNDQDLLRDRDAFFAQYYGQEVVYLGEHLTEYDADYLTICGIASDQCIHLRSIDSLTNEERCFLVKLYDPEFYVPNMDQSDLIRESDGVIEHIKDDRDVPINVADYLRSIGVLIPFRDYSVEAILELGWAKLKES